MRRVLRGKVIPADINEAWGFINLVFGGGWTPSELDKMDLDDFLDFYRIAKEANDEVKKANKRTN